MTPDNLLPKIKNKTLLITQQPSVDSFNDLKKLFDVTAKAANLCSATLNNLAFTIRFKQHYRRSFRVTRTYNRKSYKIGKEYK